MSEGNPLCALIDQCYVVRTSGCVHLIYLYILGVVWGGAVNFLDLPLHTLEVLGSIVGNRGVLKILPLAYIMGESTVVVVSCMSLGVVLIPPVQYHPGPLG